MTTIAGSGEGKADGKGKAAQFKAPEGLAIDSKGNIYVADTSNHLIRKIDPDGNVTTLAGSQKGQGFADGKGNVAQFNSPSGIVVTSDGTLYVSEFGSSKLRKITSDATVSTLNENLSGFKDGAVADAEFNAPTQLALDKDSNLYIADMFNNKIRKISRE